MSSTLVRVQKLESLLVMLSDFAREECSGNGNRAAIKQAAEIVRGVLHSIQKPT
jgi:hypothetical protein